jgi:DNA-binding NarL/FixJ family response regulator
MSAPNTLQVIIGEARPFVREGLLRVLSGVPGIAVAGAALAPQAFRRLMPQRADAAIIAACLDGADTPALVQRFAQRRPATRIIVLECDHASPSIDAFLQAGAAHYLASDATPADLLAALRAPETVEIVDRTAQPTGPPCLTAREREVAGWIATGHTSGAIATGLGISLATVISHRTNLYRKLAVHSASELVTAVIQQGLIATPGDGAH